MILRSPRDGVLNQVQQVKHERSGINDNESRTDGHSSVGTPSQSHAPPMPNDFQYDRIFQEEFWRAALAGRKSSQHGRRTINVRRLSVHQRANWGVSIFKPEVLSDHRITTRVRNYRWRQNQHHCGCLGESSTLIDIVEHMQYAGTTTIECHPS
jgi:hypothetical protein